MATEPLSVSVARQHYFRFSFSYSKNLLDRPFVIVAEDGRANCNTKLRKKPHRAQIEFCTNTISWFWSESFSDVEGHAFSDAVKGGELRVISSIFVTLWNPLFIIHTDTVLVPPAFKSTPSIGRYTVVQIVTKLAFNWWVLPMRRSVAAHVS